MQTHMQIHASNTDWKNKNKNKYKIQKAVISP